jgi:membrane-bound serine protease (ClpP class)
MIRACKGGRIVGRFMIAAFFAFSLMYPHDRALGEDSGAVWVMEINGIISPAIANYSIETLKRAEEESAECLVIKLDTPGGLDLSMREMVKEIMSATIPVVVFVYPKGSRAASAGVWITLASHIAAMAPGTNIGAAHPVMMGVGGLGGSGGQEEKGKSESGTMEEKVLNDAVAYIRAIASEKKRNAEWAEKAVRESVSITAEDALRLGVIDLICPNLVDLLEKIDGRTVLVNDQERTLHTKGAAVVEVEMPLRYRFLRIITNPNVAYLLMLLGAVGIYFELSNPGAILPGVVGVISIILALYAFQWLPINYAGLALIILAIILFIAEVKITSFGLLTVGGIFSMVLGSLMLIGPDYPYMRISWGVIVPTVLATAAFFVLALGLVLRAHHRRPVTGREGLIGEIGTAQTNLKPGGRVFVHGELWSAVSEEPIKKGCKVRIIGRNHMTLKVEESSDRP